MPVTEAARNVQMLRQGVAGYPLLFRAAQFQDRFQIIVDGFGAVRVRSWLHYR